MEQFVRLARARGPNVRAREARGRVESAVRLRQEVVSGNPTEAVEPRPQGPIVGGAGLAAAAAAGPAGPPRRLG
ncbi:MAG: hypothetical protein K1X88_35675, partial [Nannocystaceae bacterium]|nr:hypothetical protein [Nannocystaceae bacterium]